MPAQKPDRARELAFLESIADSTAETVAALELIYRALRTINVAHGMELRSIADAVHPPSEDRPTGPTAPPPAPPGFMWPTPEEVEMMSRTEPDEGAPDQGS